jgi:hypothetical protein
MATQLLQIKLIQRLVVLLSPAVLAACISSQPYPISTPLPQPLNPPQVRAPQVGQQWVYNVRNVFNQELVDVVTEKVVSVGRQIRIERNGLKAGPLPDEIQEPWGYVLQDPHWQPPQRFLQPIPLWPEQLVPGWSGFYRNRYQVVGFPENDYYWSLNISTVQWEGVTVPAGQFPTLKYRNESPYFTSNDFARVVNVRNEDVWFSPEIGRWVIRRSSGQYLWPGMSWGSALWEDYLEWELVSWK